MKSPSARLRPPDEKIQMVETDVVIVGGGVAGCLAAICPRAGSRWRHYCHSGALLQAHSARLCAIVVRNDQRNSVSV